MMMDHHRFTHPNKTSNVMIGAPRSSGSDTTDDLTASDPAATDEFDTSMIENQLKIGSGNSVTDSVGQPSSIFGDDTFDDKINMDFDLMTSDLEVTPGADISKLGISSKLGGDIGDDLDIDLLEDLITKDGSKIVDSKPDDPDEPISLDQEKPEGPETTESSESSMDQLFKNLGCSNDNNNSDSSIDKMIMGSSDNAIEKLYNMPILNMDNPSTGDKQGVSVANNGGVKNKANTANINLSLKNLHDSNGSLCDSVDSLPSIDMIPNMGTFQNQANQMNAGQLQGTNPLSAVDIPKSMGNSMQQQQQQLLMQQRQQQLFLQQQQQMLQLQHQQLLQQQQLQQQQQLGNNKNSASIESIVNNQLSQIPQINELTKMGAAGLEQEKMKLIQRLQEIEQSGVPMNTAQQQQQQQQQQQFLLQQQMLLRQKQLQQQQQRGITTPSMPRVSSGGSPFAMNQKQGVAQGKSPFSANNKMGLNNNLTTSTTNQLRQQQKQSSMIGNSNDKDRKNNVSSVMGSEGKETPLLSFLRNKRGSKNQQQLSASAATATAALAEESNHSNESLSSISSDVLDAAPIDFSSSSTNPFLRKQMMSNLDRSVNRNISARGRLGAAAGRGVLSSRVRQNMGMAHMSSSGTGMLSKSEHTPRRKFTDSYESAGIIKRTSSGDHLASRRKKITAGAAKAQNRRLSRSSHGSSAGSFGNLTRCRSKGSKRDLRKQGSNHSIRSLPVKNELCGSLSSNDSTGSFANGFVAVKRGSGLGGRGGHGAKHRLGSSSGSRRRISSVPYMNNSMNGMSAAAIQAQMEDEQQGPSHNDAWP